MAFSILLYIIYIKIRDILETRLYNLLYKEKLETRRYILVNRSVLLI